MKQDDGADGMKSNAGGIRYLCACCGEVIRPDWIIDDIICPRCIDQLKAAGPSWRDSPCGKIVKERCQR